MKKNYAYYVLLLCFPVIAIGIASFSGGVTGQSLTGSPGDGGNNCTQCHNTTGGARIDNAGVTLTVPANYEPNTTYNISVNAFSVTQSMRNGFQMTAETADGTKQGTFVAGTGSQLVSGGQTITHAGVSSNAIWDFQWTSPSTNVGNITFYSVVNASDGGGTNNSGDIIYLNSSSEVLTTQEELLATFQLYPNPVVNEINVQLPQGVTEARATVYGLTGAQLLQSTLASEDRMDVSSLPAGAYVLALEADGARSTKSFVKR